MGSDINTPAPDYTSANREAVSADFSTLESRNLLNQAAKLGQKVTYVDPFTGQTKTADFTGLGDAQLARDATNIALDMNDEMQRRQTALRQSMVTDPVTGRQMTLGELNSLQTSREVEASDPTAYAARQALTQRVNDDLNAPADTVADDGALGALAARLGGIEAPGVDGRFGDIYERATRLDASDPTTGALQQAVLGAFKDYELGGRLDDVTRREVEQASRAGQAARGNVLGNAAAFSEAMETGQAAEARKQARLQAALGAQAQAFSQGQASQEAERANLGVLSGLVSADVAQSQQAWQNRLAQVQAQAGLVSAAQAESRNVRNENYAREQQKLANASAFILGQPITNQFGSMAAAQQGSVGYNQVGYQGAIGVADPSQAAGQIYGQQATAYNNAIANQNAMQQQLIGLGASAIGGAAGMMM